jgi:hypothetical protein
MTNLKSKSQLPKCLLPQLDNKWTKKGTKGQEKTKFQRLNDTCLERHLQMQF